MEGKKPESWDSSVNHIPSGEEYKPTKEAISQVSPTQAQAPWQKVILVFGPHSLS